MIRGEKIHSRKYVSGKTIPREQYMGAESFLYINRDNEFQLGMYLFGPVYVHEHLSRDTIEVHSEDLAALVDFTTKKLGLPEQKTGDKK